LDLIAAGNTVAGVATDLGVSGQTIYSWRNHALIDGSKRARVTSSDLAELVAGRRRIAELETETKRANELLNVGGAPKRTVRGHHADGRLTPPRPGSCRVLAVLESGFLRVARDRPQRERSAPPMLAEVIARHTAVALVEFMSAAVAVVVGSDRGPAAP
jgi:transposase-like protein